MKHLILIFLIILPITFVSADEKKSVKGTDLIQAFCLYREAADNITKIHNELYSNQNFEEDFDTESPKFTKPQKKLYLKTRDLLITSTKLNPYNPEAFMYLGIFYMEVEKNHKKAFEYFSKALDIDPNYEAILSFRFNMSLKIKNFETAEKDLITLKEIGSSYYESSKQELKLAKKPRKDNKRK